MTGEWPLPGQVGNQSEVAKSLSHPDLSSWPSLPTAAWDDDHGEALLTSHPNRAVQRSLYATYPTQVTCQTATACGQSLVTQAPMKIHTVTLHILHCKDRFSCFQSKKPSACGGRSASLAEKLAISFLLFTLEQRCSISENHPNHAKRFAGVNHGVTPCVVTISFKCIICP